MLGFYNNTKLGYTDGVVLDSSVVVDYGDTLGIYERTEVGYTF